ncbi:hypothetical protein ERX46_02000 [Brumimicrobium glaciale]|uniref:tRNA_anti-like n=2 Tax=Brumimicrobium glaciale TaxID=200475 RepID=A0A4V1WG82_9FLAO|nr:hypothetical protein ERX46_02000 [Brumimicrobium glaciale]
MKSMKKYILLGILSLIIVGGGIGYYMFNKKVPTLENTTSDYVIGANDLFNEFENNESEALKKYENKIIEVTGKVISVKNNDNDSNIILEADMAMAGGVNCSFKYKQDEEITKGSIVTIKGQCQGFLMDVVLNNSQLIK